MDDQTQLKDRTLFYDGSSSISLDKMVDYLLRFGPDKIYCSETGYNLRTKSKSDPLEKVHWDIPEEYQNRDVVTEIYKMASLHGVKAVTRVGLELEEFQRRGMIPLLKILLYIVERMKKEGKAWGVGRGSSCAVYTLYLMDVHCVDSLKFNLPMDEFFR